MAGGGAGKHWIRSLRIAGLLMSRTWPIALFNAVYVVIVLFFVIGAVVQRSPQWWLPLLLGIVGAGALLGTAVLRVESLGRHDLQYLDGPLRTEFGADSMRLDSKLGALDISYKSVTAFVHGFGFVALVRQSGNGTIYLPEELVPESKLESTPFPRRLIDRKSVV